jgi:hypothetical protein
MKIRLPISLLPVLAVLALPAAASSPVTAAQVAAVLHNIGMKTTEDQIDLPANVVSASATPALRIESMEVWGDHQLKVRLGCGNAGECLPFFVTVHGSQPQAASTQAVENPLPRNMKPNPDAASSSIRAGSKATLLLDGGHVHIRIKVVCLQNGSAGQVIRVVSLDHRQTYMAEISEGNILRGKL